CLEHLKRKVLRMENQKHWWNTPEGIEWLSDQPEIEQMFFVNQRKRCPLPNLDKSQDREGWKEATIAWEVCASLHREYCKGKDPFYKTRQADFVKHAEVSREKALSNPCSTEDKTDAERYRW